jgi:hypothetical protein
MFSTALRHRWLALNDGVNIGERCVGYAAEEWSRMTVLQLSDTRALKFVQKVLTYGRRHGA